MLEVQLFNTMTSQKKLRQNRRSPLALYVRLEAAILSTLFPSGL